MKEQKNENTPERPDGSEQINAVIGCWRHLKTVDEAIKANNRKIAVQINKCFDKEVRSQTFNVNGQIITVNGEDTFYKKSDIDRVIKKLNKLIRKLER